MTALIKPKMYFNPSKYKQNMRNKLASTRKNAPFIRNTRKQNQSIQCQSK